MSDIKIFDIGTVYPEKNTEEIHVAYADSSGIVESTLEEFTRELSLDAHMEEYATTNIKFIPWSAYPFITRDVAVWVPVAIGADELISLCKEEGTELLVRDPELFDEFIKDDKKSLAVRMVFQASDRTLTDDEIGGVMQKISQKIQDRGFEVR
jgi:phenylalanyl-tRNA synthetase beta chain